MNAVDYSFYTNRFGGKLSAEDFMRLLPYASAYLSELTCGRADGDLSDDLAERVRYALCALVDAWRVNEQGGGIASESIGTAALPQVGDHILRGALTDAVNTPADLAKHGARKILAVGDNRRGQLAHVVVIGQ